MGGKMPILKKRQEVRAPAEARPPRRVKFEIYGEEMIQKKVKPSGASGRVYLPPDWVDRNVKIIRID
jgi:putative transposon-encoded protein